MHQKSLNSDWVIVNAAASMRVLNVLRHWVTKHPFDFSENSKLKEETLNLMQTMLNDANITETEKKVAEGITKQLNSLQDLSNEIASNLEMLLSVPDVNQVI